jgi:uncharacterized DUF497 family protein
VVTKVLWNPAKAESNVRKHGIRFQEAETVFEDDQIVSIEDLEHSHE